MTNFKNRSDGIWKNDLVFYGFLIVYGALVIFLSYKINIWEDEAYSLHTTSNNLATVISQSYDFEGQPPVYFILLAIWRHIDSGIFFARLFSLFFIGLSSVFFYRLVRLVSGAECSRWMLIIFLLNPFAVWAALEIRPYSLIIFLSTISIYYFFRFYIDNKKKYLYLFLLTSLIGLYTQYFFILEIASLALSLLVFKGWKIFFKFCLYLIPLIVLFIPNLFFVQQQVEMVQSYKLEYSIVNRIFTVLHSPPNLMLAFQIIPLKAIKWGFRVIFILIIIYSYFKLYKRQLMLNDPYFGRFNFILVSIFTLVVLYTVLIAITGIIHQDKYMAIVFPLFILVFTLLKVYSFFNSNLMYAVISIYYISLLILNYKYPVKSYDFKSVGKFVNKIEHSKEPILVYGLLPPFTYYYTGPNLLVPIPAVKFDHNYYEKNIDDTSELKKAIQKIDSPAKSYILIIGNLEGYKYTMNMNQQMIDECLAINYNVTLDTSFLGKNKDHTLRIRRLEIR